MPLHDFVNRSDDDEQKEVSYFQHRFVLRPEYWNAYKNTANLNWQRVKATTDHASSISNTDNGVYSFVVEPAVANHPGAHYLMYVGKAEDQSLRDRFRQYLREAKDPKGRPLVVDMFTKWPDHLWFYFAPVPTVPDIHQLELDLIGAFVPPQNDRLPVEIARPIKAAWRR